MCNMNSAKVKIIGLLLSSFLFSCNAGKKDEVFVITQAFNVAYNVDVSVKDIDKYFQFPFFNDGFIEYSPNDFAAFLKKTITSKEDVEKFKNSLKITILESYTLYDYPNTIVEDEKLVRFIELIKDKGNYKVLKVSLNSESYIENNKRTYIILNSVNQKIIGIIEL